MGSKWNFFLGFMTICGWWLLLLLGLVLLRKVRGTAKRDAEERAAIQQYAATPRLVVRESREVLPLNPNGTLSVGGSDAADLKVVGSNIGDVHFRIYLKRNATRPDSWFAHGAGMGPVKLKRGAAPWETIRGRRKVEYGDIIKIGDVELEVYVF